MRQAILVLLLSALSAFAEPASYKLHHRVYHTTLPQIPYSERGAILISDDNTAVFQSSPSASDDLRSFAESVKELDSSLDNLYYQVALQRGNANPSSWDFKSIKACHLLQATSQTLILHTQDTEPFALDYFISPIPPDGSCPKLKTKLKQKVESISPLTTFADNIQQLNTAVFVKPPHVPRLPELRQPQPVTPTGQPVQPVPEKSFIQKYWMYIVAALIALSMYIVYFPPDDAVSSLLTKRSPAVEKTTVQEDRLRLDSTLEIIQTVFGVFYHPGISEESSIFGNVPEYAIQKK